MTLGQWKPTAWEPVVRQVPQARVLADQMAGSAALVLSAGQPSQPLRLMAAVVVMGLNYQEPFPAAVVALVF
jgi:hypothetical protein